MKELTDKQEIYQYKQELQEQRLSEQSRNNDYADPLDDGGIELCGDCGTPINSHDHCPICDY